MPQYMVLIYTPVESPLSPEEFAAMAPRYDSYTEGLREAGVLVAGDALEPADVATTLRERGGEVQITDGPFAETKEYLAGYYLLDCPDLDTALDHAKGVPAVAFGSIEVRPVWDRTGPPMTRESLQAQA
jgi:hypothetical protein